MSKLAELRNRWNELPAQRRRLIMLGTVFVLIVIASKVFKAERTPPKVREKPPEMSIVTAPRTQDGVAEMRTKIDGLTNQLDREKTRSLELERKVAHLTESGKDIESRAVQELSREVQSLREDIKLQRSMTFDPTKTADKSLLPDLPPPVDMPKVEPPPRPKLQTASSQTVATASTSPNPPVPSAQVSSSGAPNRLSVEQRGAAPTVSSSVAATVPASQVAVHKTDKGMQYIPAGTILQGVTMNGVDAPTSGMAQRNTVPILMRIKKDAILPSRMTQDLRECFLVLSGYGVMSSERVKARTEVISCIRSDGGVIESKIDGFIVDIDGKEGMKGTLVTKQGSLIARGLLAGFVSGFGQMMTPTMGSTLSLNTNNQSYLSPDVAAAGQAGALRGVNQAAQDYAKFFMETAKEMHPVIELQGGLEATVVLVRGASLAINPNPAERKESWQAMFGR